jgi:uncharacterized protein YdeI (YjbR/CyaY-like superfamily)
VDGYFKRAKKWEDELAKLRELALEAGLVEELKWGKPCYTREGVNVVLIIGFKDYCSLLLPKGALLKDAKGILVKAGENTQAARQIRFTGLAEIVQRERDLRAYLREAIAVEKAGLKVEYKKITEHAVPEELQRKLDAMPALQKAFAALTPGRQRGYYMHIAGAKQAATRESRVEKCVPMILAGKGWGEEWRGK